MKLAFAERLDRRQLLSASYLLNSLSSFNGTNGEHPHAAPILDPAGNLLGTAGGTAFEIVHGTTAVTSIAASGAGPYGLTLDSNGNLFGTNPGSGGTDYGSVFEIFHGTATVTTFASFNRTNGADPEGGLVLDSNGNLFGTTYVGGANNEGTVFEIVHGAITTLASFNGAINAYPEAGVTLDASGNLFGTTSEGYGSVFEVVHGTNAITTVASLNGANGTFPSAGVTLDSNGNLFGTTVGAGGFGYGTVFEVVHGTNTVTTLPASTAATALAPTPM